MRVTWATDPVAVMKRAALGIRRGMARGLETWTRKTSNQLKGRAERPYRDSTSGTTDLAHLRATLICRSPIGMYREYGTGIYGPRHRRITARGRMYRAILGRLARRRVLHWVDNGTDMFAMSTKGTKKRPWFWPIIRRRIKALQIEIAKQVEKQVARLTAASAK